MILGINIPDNAKVEIVNGKVLIIFDDKQTRVDMWKARFDMWLTEGDSQNDFSRNSNLDSKAIVVTHRNKIKQPSQV